MNVTVNFKCLLRISYSCQKFVSRLSLFREMRRIAFQLIGLRLYCLLDIREVGKGSLFVASDSKSATKGDLVPTRIN